ncbi:MAG TPA: nucleotidyltransferase family protein [Candidatus Nanoarchaeia archaeon]|nr:nucleotidyltransferase family protein [Candidatus Nanoarchaeia archaeon]
MKAVILAAGYGTRLEKELADLKESSPKKYSILRPIVEGIAKPMINVAGKPIVQHTVENIERTDADKIFIVTNNRYHRQFEEWKDSYNSRIPLKLINDRTNTNDERLGAVYDLLLVLKQEAIEDDTLVIAGDNLLKLDLRDLVGFFNEVQTSIVVAYREKDKDRIKRSACVEFDDNHLVISFEEKPKNPRSDWICPAIYLYSADTIKLIKEMKFDHDKRDFIGNIPMLLYSRIHIHAFAREDKIRFDIGTLEELAQAESYFRGAR